MLASLGYWFSWDVWGIPLESAGLSCLLVAPFALAGPLLERWRSRRAERAWQERARRQSAPLALEAPRLLAELDRWDRLVPREWQRDHSR